MLPQYDQVRGEFPVQHPGVPYVGDGGGVYDGGSVGGVQSSGSSVSIQEHTPAISQSSPFVNELQNENVRGEYPVQHPSFEYVGDGVVGDPVGHAVAVGGAGDVVGAGKSHSEGSSVVIHSHEAAASQAL